MKRFLTVLLLFALAGCGQRETAAPPSGADSKKPETQATSTAGEEDPTLRVGSSLPKLQLSDINGKTADLSQMKGRVTLLNVWATWCGPCRVEIPELIAIQNEMHSKGVDVVGISVDSPDAVDEVRDFIAEQKMNYRNLLDPEGEFAARFEASVIPISLLVDRSGKVVWIHYGLIERTNQEFQNRLQKALAS